LSVAKRN